MLEGKKWRVAFLGVTAVAVSMAVSMELWAWLDGNPDTEPWTYFVVEYVPEQVTYSVVSFGAGWLIWHFWSGYSRKKRRNG